MRTHTKSIYAKLGVNSRRAAVRRAEELNLLSRKPPQLTLLTRLRRWWAGLTTGRSAGVITSLTTSGDVGSPDPVLAFDHTDEQPGTPPGR